MNFLNLPEEVIEGHLLSCLEWNDILRFRRVCKATKVITDGFLNLHPELAPEIEINEKDKSLADFLAMGISTTKIHLKNVSGGKFYENNEEDVDVFLERYEAVIKSLRVDKLSLDLSQHENELDFVEALVNLQTLEIGHFDYARNYAFLSSEEEHDSFLYRDNTVVPKVCQKLQTLKIGQESNVWQPIRKKIDRTVYRYLQKNATILEYACLPFTAHTEILDNSMQGERRDPQYSMNVIFLVIGTCITTRAKFVTDRGTNLKVYDFANFHDPEIALNVHLNAPETFPRLCHTCVQHGVKLRNVSSVWLHNPMNPTPPAPQIGVPIVSLVNIHPWILSLDMPNLERIEITATSKSFVGRDWRTERSEWPALKQLDITVDSRKSQQFVGYSYGVYGISGETKTLFQVFFQDVVRPELTELRFNFVEEAAEVTVPKVIEIGASCPNLRKLTLVNWPGTNKALNDLFGGLPKLEEISLEYCKGLGNVAFVGADVKKPVFFKLPKLKKLSLKGLDQMPKITDLLFSMVISHLGLTHLTLTSDSPIKSVSIKGIRSLLQGNLAQSIEKFSFQNWSLEDVSTEEFQKLEKEFRSYYML